MLVSGDMQVLVVSDIHANRPALDSVLADASADGRSYDAVWCLGDLIGYGPDPNECVERVRRLPNLVCLIGNHDQAALGIIPLARFNHDARVAAAWTGEVLTAENRAFLGSLPSHLDHEGFTLAHGSPRQPLWEYILDPATADRNFEVFTTDFCLVGHSHFPLVFRKETPEAAARPVAIPWDRSLTLSPRMIMNPGSVGQPRDLDPRAAYALLDAEHLTWSARRVAYDVRQVQQRMLEAGLPERQALRLLSGW
jgi:diadenosine tetraphosphatase ApaH/serine/threonine PP2A family protein phosphatase